MPVLPFVYLIIGAAAFVIPVNSKLSVPLLHQSVSSNPFIETPSTSKTIKPFEASMSSTAFNIAKSIVGAGVLSLPSGVAIFSDSPRALIPASLLCVGFGLISSYSYCLIGKACELQNSSSFQDLWEKSSGPRSAQLLSAGITAQSFLSALAYSIIIGIFVNILKSFLFCVFN